jgi:hypothetical protein
MLDPDLSPEELSVKRLGEKASVIHSAAAEITKGALTCATFHVLKTPAIHKKLRKELMSVMPERELILPLSDLEKFSNLAATI